MSQHEASLRRVARYMDAIPPFVAIAFCPRINWKLVSFMTWLEIGAVSWGSSMIPTAK